GGAGTDTSAIVVRLHYYPQMHARERPNKVIKVVSVYHLRRFYPTSPRPTTYPRFLAPSLSPSSCPTREADLDTPHTGSSRRVVPSLRSHALPAELPHVVRRLRDRGDFCGKSPLSPTIKESSGFR